jgi:hypothetical protein
MMPVMKAPSALLCSGSSGNAVALRATIDELGMIAKHAVAYRLPKRGFAGRERCDHCRVTLSRPLPQDHVADTSGVRVRCFVASKESFQSSAF